MKTWNDYKEHVKSIGDDERKEMEAIEDMSSLITSIIKQRNALGISQRELASMCGIPQSSVARIEACRTTPKIDMLLKIIQHLGMRISLSPITT